MKPHTFLLFLFCFFLTFSCKEDTDPGTICSVEDPVEDLAWLAAEIEALRNSNSSLSQYFYISRARYGPMTVFIVGNCCPHCGTIVPAYNCSGDLIGYLGYGEGNINPSILGNDEVIWRPDNFSCNF